MYRKAVVNNQVGLHARPATFSSRKPTSSRAPFGWRRTSAGERQSLLGVLSLGIVKGTSISLLQTAPTRKKRWRL